jgi:hypothetical protein
LSAIKLCGVRVNVCSNQFRNFKIDYVSELVLYIFRAIDTHKQVTCCTHTSLKCLYALKMAVHMIAATSRSACIIQELVKFVGDKLVYIYLFQNVHVYQIRDLVTYLLSLLYISNFQRENEIHVYTYCRIHNADFKGFQMLFKKYI